MQAMYEELYRLNLWGRLEVDLEAGGKTELAKSRWIDLPFKEAIAIFKSKTKILSKKAYAVLSDALKQKSFFIAGGQTEYTMNKAKESIAASIEKGWSKQRWINFARDNGIPNLGKHHLEVVFNTNVLSSYQHGRYKQQQTPGMKKIRPILVYRTVGDERVRENHAAMDGFAAHRDHIAWNTWYPTNGFMCRCRVEAKRLSDIEEVFPIDENPGIEPDEGWATNPGEWLK